MSVVKGAKGGSKNQRTPKIANDTAASKTYVRILYGTSEGEVEGLAKGLSSIYLDDTPIEGPAGGKNFEDLTLGFRTGTNDQEHIEGFEDISSETAVGVELKDITPWVKAISDTSIDAVNIRLKWGALREQNAENGDVTGITIEYAIDVQTDGGVWETMLDTKISDKTSANYERQHRIGLPRADRGWQIRVRRITPNSTSEYISDKMYVQAITEVVDLKLAYPNTALVGVQYDAEAFSNIAKIAVEIKGIKLKVPSNYNPIRRKYNGIWDGTFKRVYTNNPAWIYYDICTAKRYALGDRLTAAMIDKWALYRLAQYCDQLVPDGKGGEEPRFTCNVYIQSTEDAYSILMKLAGVFRAINYWDGNSIICDADLPQDTYFTYTRANVIDGIFEYSGTRARDRHTVAKVAWDNPQNRYKTEYVYVRDEKAIGRLGVRIVEIDAWGCTSEGQAQRAGQWALKSEQLETRTVAFKVGLDGYIPQPGKVIEIADELFAGRANGGRVAQVSVDFKSITVDRDDVVCRPGDRLVVNGENGKAQARIVSSIAGRVITVVAAFDSVAAQNVWVVDARDLATMKFRVMSISQSDKHQFTINALQYNSAKYDAIDHGAFIDEQPISIINTNTQKPVDSVVLTSESRVEQGINISTMMISFPQAEGATKYQVEWRRGDGSWIKMPITGNNSVEVPGIYAGNYEARVIAISAFEIASLPTYSPVTALTGKEGMPPKLAFIKAMGILFGMKLDWGFPAIGALDTAYTEIEVSPDGVANITQLGQFSYPTNTHTVQGLQGNLIQNYRGRLIDRIGNIGEWSEWVSGETSADASAILDILSGKIKETQLHKDLQEKIEQIDIINTDIEGTNKAVKDAQDAADKANTNLAVERDERIEDIRNTQDAISKETRDRQSEIKTTKDGLSKEIKDGDDGVMQIVDTLKKSTNDGFAAVQSDIKVVADDQRILAEKTDGVYAQLNPPLAGSQDLAGNGASLVGVWSLQSAMIEGDMALGKRVDTVNAEVGKNQASIQEERTARIDGDKATAEAIDKYISSNDTTLAAVERKATSAVDESSANAQLINSLDGRVKIAEDSSGKALENSASAINKAEIAVDKAGSAVTVSNQAQATAVNAEGKALIAEGKADEAEAKADTALSNSATALTKSSAAADDASAAIDKVDSIEARLGDYATTGALESVDSKIMDVDGRVVAQTTKIDGVYAQINPPLAGSQDLAGNNSTMVGVWSEQSARIEGDMAQAKRTDQVSAEMHENNAVYQQQVGILVDADKALAESILTVKSDFESNKSTVQSQIKTVSDAQSAQSSRIDTVQASSNSAQMTADNALAEANKANTNLATVQTKVDATATAQSATAKQVNTLQTSVGENTASIQEQKQSIDGIYTQWTMKLSVNGYVTGIGMMNDGKTSDFLINSDSFALGAAYNGGAVTYPFIFRATPYTDPETGTIFPVGAYMKSIVVDHASIKTAHIQDLAVKTLKIGLNAVTVMTAAQFVSRLTISTFGGPIRIDAGVTIRHLVDLDPSIQIDTIQVRITRNGMQIHSTSYRESYSYYNPVNKIMNYSFIYDNSLPAYVDSPATGTYTYRVEIMTLNPNTGKRTGVWEPLFCSLSLFEVKR